MRVSVAIVARASASRMSLQFWLHKAAVQITGVDFLSCTGVQSKGFRCCKQVDKGDLVSTGVLARLQHRRSGMFLQMHLRRFEGVKM